jgi:hypothetical protein
MGYACPVCETPQRDAEHLADHLAFTAMLHGDAHEQWLDEHAPGWVEAGAADLAPVVTDHAEETPYEEVFEESLPAETPERRGGHDHDLPSGTAPPQVGSDVSDDTRRVIAQAREMTRTMVEEEENADDQDRDGEPDDQDRDGDEKA